MGACAKCGDPDFYIGLFGGDCPNPSCDVDGTKRKDSGGTTATKTDEWVSFSDTHPGIEFEVWTSYEAKRNGVTERWFQFPNGRVSKGLWVSISGTSAATMEKRTGYDDVEVLNGFATAYKDI